MAQPRSRFPAYPPDLPEGLQLYLEAIRKEISTLGVSGGASIRIEESDAVVSTAANVIDFFGTDFDVTQSPVGEANVAISSAIARTGHTHDAADVTTGIFSRARLPSQLAYEDEPNTFTLTQTFSVQLVSSVTTGTAPFSVASTTVVTNLNADFLDGQTGTFYTDLANATGNLAYARLPTGGGTWANGGTLSITGGVTTVAGLTSSADITAQARLLLTTAASKIVPGATSLALRNTADSADNAIWTNAGDATFRTKLTMPGPLVLTTAASTIVPGATSLALRNTADNANNLLVTDAGISTFRNDVVMDVLGTYDHTGTRFTTGTGPVADDVLSYHGGAGKWRPRFLQAAFTSGVAVSQSNTDGTFATFFNSNPTLSGTPTAPTNAPVTTAMYKAILIDMSAYSLGGTQAYVLDYSINGGGYTTNKIISTSTKVIHSGLDPANTYAYKYKIRGGSDSTYSPASAAINPSSTTEANAFGLIVASQIATAYLSAINANIGSITAGQLISGDGKSLLQLDSTFSIPGTVTQGIFFASANPVPGGITGMYIDFTATSTNPLLHHAGMDLRADGTAIFKGFIDIVAAGLQTYGTFAKHAIRVHDSGIGHGITDILPNDAFGLIGGDPTTADGGFIVTGVAVSTAIEALGLYGLQVTGSATKAAVAIVGAKKSGTTFGALASTEKVFGVWNNNTELVQVFGDGSVKTTAHLLVGPAFAGNAGIELGRQDGTASTPYVDFHSGATAADYDSRLIASGGSGASGGGTLAFVGVSFTPTTAAGATLGTSSLPWGEGFFRVDGTSVAQLSLDNNTANARSSIVLTNQASNVMDLAWESTEAWVRTQGSVPFTIYTNNSQRWQVTSSGHFVSLSDNTYDIGANGASRPRDLYVAGAGTFGNGVSATGVINASSNYSISGNQVVSARQTGWSAFTGTTNIGTVYATGTITLVQLAQRVAAIQAALTTHGLIGA